MFMQKCVLGAAVIAVVLFARETPARACGGCFSPPSQNPTVVTDHRMILSVSLEQTTLYDQIEYSGSPDSFAWVLPIAGTVDVGLSADVVFDTLDALTHTNVYAPPLGCPPPPADCDFGFTSADASASADAGGVTVLKSQVVGPYETVQLASSDPQALNDWLTGHGFDIPADVQPVIDAYVSEGFDFLAMKLVPGASVQSMRPVRVTSQGASPVLPLRMVAAGTGATVGITLWVVAEGRYEPANFPFFRIADSDIIWDYATSSSNYATLRQDQEQASNGFAWEMESSLPLNETQFDTYVDNGGSPYPLFDNDAGTDYASATTDDGGTETAEQVRDADLATLFEGMNAADVRVTRIRSDLSRAALATDLTVQASADQSVLTNSRYPSKSVNAPPCPNYDNCPKNPNGNDGGDGDGFSAMGGCGVSPESNGSTFLAFGALAIAFARGLARRRKR
jgi:MYXO-CTERM domain-containing protein